MFVLLLVYSFTFYKCTIYLMHFSPFGLWGIYRLINLSNAREALSVLLGPDVPKSLAESQYFVFFTFLCRGQPLP